jgi:hypothetical protein
MVYECVCNFPAARATKAALDRPRIFKLHIVSEAKSAAVVRFDI